ncbi:MAG: DUF1127 domain-containing protein [Gammaproteobacteria bacterium]|nr:DUF1127 domain-containing protein [Gammaproteobacteria bacterium]
MSNPSHTAARAPFYELVAPNLYVGKTIAELIASACDAVMEYRRRIVERRRIAETVAALRGLDDRGLSDIGVHRSQIRAVAQDAVEREAWPPRRARQ